MGNIYEQQDEIAALRRHIDVLEAALREIAKMEPQPITAEFKQGPQLCFDNCRRIARRALHKLKRK